MPTSGQPSLTFRENLAALILAISFVLATSPALGQKMPEATKGPSVAPSFILGNPEDYAGIDRCRSCHKPEYREYEKTAHAQLSASPVRATSQAAKSATVPARHTPTPSRPPKATKARPRTRWKSIPFSPSA